MSLVQPGVSQQGQDFSPGFLDTPDPVTLPPGATPDARNAFLYRLEYAGTGKTRTTMGTRPTHALLTPAASPAATVKGDGLHEFRREINPRILLAKIGTAWFRFNETDLWDPLNNAIGFTAGRSGRVAVLNNEVVLHDGTRQVIYDGEVTRELGFPRPTGLSNMVAGAAPGPTGTYTARYTWYDIKNGHESSPTVAATASLTITNQSRIHARPAGTPPANVSHWRAYVRREDTFERYWMHVGDQSLAGVTYEERFVDAARRTRIPEDFENEPPGVVFNVLATWKGHGIGFSASRPDMHISKQGDLESWDPAHVFKGVLSQGGDLVVSAHNYGTEIVIQKPTQTFYLAGDRVPFAVVDLHSGFGNVSQDAAMEIAGLFYAWDRDKGPYRTDLGGKWEPLGEGRIDTTLATVRRDKLSEIRIGHDPIHNLVCWVVPATTGQLPDMILAYNYVLNCWYPPITGLEIGALTTFLRTTGMLGLFAVDHQGRLHQLFAGGLVAGDSIPSGTVSGTGQMVDVALFRDTGAAFYTEGLGLQGRRLAVRPPGGTWEWRYILFNSATDLLLREGFYQTVPAGSEYRVGAVEWYWHTPPFDAGTIGRQKRAGWLLVQQSESNLQVAGVRELEVGVRFDTDVEPSVTRRFDLPASKNFSFIYPPIGDLHADLTGLGTPPYSEWVLVAGGPKYLEVDDPLAAPDDDLTVLTTETSGARQGFRTAAMEIPTRSHSIDVAITVRALVDLGNVTLAAGLLMGGTVYGALLVGTFTPGAYQTFSATFTVNPKTNVAWIPADLAPGLAVVLTPTFTLAPPHVLRVTLVSVRVAGFYGPRLATQKTRLQRAFYTAQLRFRNYWPNQAVEVKQYQLDADWLPRRSARSGS